MNEKEGINILPVVGSGSNTDTATAWEGMMTNLGLPMQDEPHYNQEALYVTMQMICSDDAETLMSYLGMQDLNNGNRETLFKLVYKLALNKLCDKDKMFNIREYFKL